MITNLDFKKLSILFSMQFKRLPKGKGHDKLTVERYWCTKHKCWKLEFGVGTRVFTINQVPALATKAKK